MVPQFKICPDGVYIRHDGPTIYGWEKIERADDLIGFAGDQLSQETPKIGLTWHGAKIPMSVISPVLGTIRDFPDMETGYTLYYNRPAGKWTIGCPRQFGYQSAVFFENDGEMPDGYQGYYQIGTIHTHPNMGAFWSGMDLSTNAKRFGLHMVFGLREGKVKESKITIFTPRAHYDVAWRDIFEEDVSFLADDLPNNPVWKDRILEQFQPDFKLTVDGKIYGPHVQNRKDMPKLYSEKELQFMHDSIQMAAREVVVKKKVKPKSKFQKLLVEKYGYDANDLADWIGDQTDSGFEDAEEVCIYNQNEDGCWGDGIMASNDMRGFLDDSDTAFGSEFKLNMTVNEQILVTVLYERITSCNLVEKAHAAEDLDEYDEDLKIIFEYIPEETLRILIEDFRDQLDFACDMGNDVLFGGRLLTPTAFRWAEAAMRNPGVDHTGRDLAEALDRCADMNGCLSWHAMALLLVALETTPMTCIHLWELYQRMKKEGRLEEC